MTIGKSVNYLEGGAISLCKNLKTIYFKGDAPKFEQNVFYKVKATAYYPRNNETWTKDVLQNHGGTIKWIKTVYPTIDLSSTDVTVESFQTASIEVSGLITGDEVVSWTSKDPEIALVDNKGIITGNKAGETDVTVTLLSGLTADVHVTVTPPGIIINPNQIILAKYCTKPIVIANLSEKDMISSCSSADPSIATVDNTGLITAVNEGQTVITVTTAYGGSATVNVTVVEPQFTISPSEMTLSIFGSEQIIVSNLTGDDKVVSWDSADKTIATVDSLGMVNAAGAGETIITVSFLSGMSIDIPVTVTEPTMELSTSEVVIPIFSSEKITVSNLVEGDRVISWKSANPEVATVNNAGTVRAVKPGRTFVTVTLLSGLTAEVEVIITGPTITLSETDVVLPVFGKKQILVSGLVEGDEVDSWKSEDRTIASVDSTGKITAKKAGETIITVTLLSGMTADIYVTVTGPTIELSQTEVEMTTAETERIRVSGLVEGDSVISWESADTSVAIVNDSGIITAKHCGKTTLTVTC